MRMRALLSMVLVVSTSLGCQRDQEPSAQAKPSPADVSASAKEAAALQGTWKVESGGESGTAGALIVLSGTDVRFISANLPRGAEGLHGTYTLDPTVTPKQIDWKFPNLPPTAAIYELEGDTLRIGVNEDATSLGRPTHFPASSGPSVMVLRRQK